MNFLQLIGFLFLVFYCCTKPSKFCRSSLFCFLFRESLNYTLVEQTSEQFFNSYKIGWIKFNSVTWIFSMRAKLLYTINTHKNENRYLIWPTRFLYYYFLTLAAQWYYIEKATTVCTTLHFKITLNNVVIVNLLVVTFFNKSLFINSRLIAPNWIAYNFLLSSLFFIFVFLVWLDLLYRNWFCVKTSRISPILKITAQLESNKVQ